ncbi:MAG: GerMN domain-containing protein [Acidobacteria bacterium]|jgi:germination protein M|nr:GerMN domain-containing protein [Acidobacteriota bacterium]
MNRRAALIAVALASLLIVLYLVLRSGGGGGGEVSAPGVLPTPTPAPEQKVMLLFLGRDGLLHPELRMVSLPAETEQRVRAVVSEILAGPSGRLLPVVPYQAQLLDVFIDGDGHAFVDLSPPDHRLEGSNIELVLTYGIVDSVLLNCPDLVGVQILFGGHEVPTLTGHLDLSAPLRLNKGLIATS